MSQEKWTVPQGKILFVHCDRKFCGNFFKCKQQVLDSVAYNFSAVEACGAWKFCFPFYANVKTGKGDLL